MEFKIKPIGIVRVESSDEEVRNSYTGVDGVIEIYPEYEIGLDKIDGFSHIIAIFYLHKVTEKQRRVLKVKHRRLRRFGIDISNFPEVGVFCTDSPHRPNPIALTILRLNTREGRFLYVSGLDVFDKTPVIDIKPYTPDRIIPNISLPTWFINILKIIRKRLGREIAP